MSKRGILVAALCGLLAVACGEETIQTPLGSGCGNGRVESGEACDDGNRDDGDGCSSDCHVIEDGYECPKMGGACSSQTEPWVAECGDGKVASTEACDDGNVSDGDGCSADCARVEAGYVCPPRGGACALDSDQPGPGPGPGPDEPECGDGVIAGSEVCDDGNAEGGDGCSADCRQIENGYACPKAGYDCVSSGCGNKILEDGEECDNGPQNVEYSYFGGECSTSCKAAHYCGDGKLDAVDIENGEACDDGKDTSASYEGCTEDCRRVNYCGDGKKTHEEGCDDGDTTDGDGCSSTCQMEPNYVCQLVDGRSVCAPILCGNGHIDEGDECDDGNRVSGDGCSAACLLEKGYIWADGAVKRICGDGILQNTKTGAACADPVKENCELCDDGNLVNGDGCNDKCTVEPGFMCPEVGKSCVARSCGDGIIASGEECDDGFDPGKGVPVSGDGCSARCKLEDGYHCPEAGKPCVKGKCGDGFIDGGETCDEGGAQASGGCVSCQIQKGWKCDEAGKACVKTVCGDGVLEGSETCEDSSACCVDCQMQTGCHCDADGKNCAKGSCGDGILDVGEECDDGADPSKRGKAGDGCSPVCTIEPIFDCVNGVCKPTCGDGLVLAEAGEECDDGNLISGDGCSSQCKRESGYSCEVKIATTPGQITLPIVYRDFIRYVKGSGNGDGYVSQALYDSLPASCKPGSNQYRHTNGANAGNHLVVGRPSPDFYSYCPDSHCLDAVLQVLDKDGKPALNTSAAINNAVTAKKSEGAYDGTDGSKCMWLYTCPEVFKWWYKDVPGINRRIDSTITLTEAACDASIKKPGTYCYTNSSFYPINSGGYGISNSNGSSNGEFTSEFQTYFKYNGGETLIFNGDDDVWVFFNGRLGVDVGGIHPAWNRQITLDTKTAADKFDMFPGGIYSLDMFHAERCTGGSSFRLSLAGFVAMGTSTCSTVCGDGVIAGDEECDYNGNPTDAALNKKFGCIQCRKKSFCGNGLLEAGEGCEPDDTNGDWCVNCRIKTCGNGALDPNEQCDGKLGVGEGQVCLDTCRISGCGDGYVDASIGEECDDGNASDDDKCTHLCKEPYCGDGIVTPSLGEVCDDGKNDGTYNGCGLGCSYAPPRCGDGVLDSLNGEDCDDGEEANKGGYGACTAECKHDSYCGDGILQDAFEQCDEGEKNGTSESTCDSGCSIKIN
ncbi:MAG: DUF4215 domain-containing protein [Proteobacteria bacterium]|nr:DUF4215 domain-containing protein [Pseudomonadota bacterium]